MLVHAGPAFKGAAQSNMINHTHSSSMAHIAAGRRQIARALGSVHSMGQPGIMGQPVMGQPPPPVVPPMTPAPAGAPMAVGAPPGPAMPPPAPSGGPGMGVAPGIGQAPGVGLTRPPGFGVMAGHTAAPTPPPPAGGNFKMEIAHKMATGVGLSVTHNDVKNAIASATQNGQFSPEQGAALIAHTGPLTGAGAVPTKAKIMTALVAQHRNGGLQGMGMPGAAMSGPASPTSGLFADGPNT